MTDPTEHDPAPDGFADLPMQPTGSGVADLAMTYEAMKVAEDDGSTVGEADPVPMSRDSDAGESEAHPS